MVPDPQFTRQGGRVAIYARLSVNEKGERDESLETQCQLLQGYVEQNKLGDYDIYVDNDISGTCFHRPGLLRLVEDINAGNVNIIVVKDLSRLGRNNGETLTFLDFLRVKDVRLISLGDNYDSFRDDDEVIGIRTWVNEHYARDISKKVRYNLRKKMQNGQFLGRPPFGYLKSDPEKNKLVVDERYRDIIKQIFDLYIKGWGYRALADYVQEKSFPTPSQDKGYAGRAKAHRWNEQHIRRIIMNRVYCGDTVQGVSEKISFKSKRTRRVDREKWIVVPDTHEPIISREIYNLAQNIRLKRRGGCQGRKKSDQASPHLFTGFLTCAACGYNHIYRKKRNRPAGYICGQYNRLGRKICSSHYVTEDKLVRYIIDDIKIVAKNISFQRQLLEKYRQEKNGLKDVASNIRKMQTDVEYKRQQLQIAYLDRIRGIISEKMFLETKAYIEREIKFLTESIYCAQEKLAMAQGESQIFELINNLTVESINPRDIDRVFLEKFVRKIIVLESGETISEKLREKYGLDLLVQKKLQDIQQGMANPVIIYDITL